VALTRDSTLELSLHILGGRLFEGISTTACRQGEGDRAQNREGLHLFILGDESAIAIADCGLRKVNRQRR
jgi:hypothetical protein